MWNSSVKVVKYKDIFLGFEFKNVWDPIESGGSGDCLIGEIANIYPSQNNYNIYGFPWRLHL